MTAPVAREARNVPSFDWTRNGMHIRQSVTEGDYVLREDYEALGKRLSDSTTRLREWETRIVGALVDAICVPVPEVGDLAGAVKAITDCGQYAMELQQRLRDLLDDKPGSWDAASAALAKNPNPSGRHSAEASGGQSPEASGPVGLGPHVERTEHFHGISLEADFETDTWTFRMESPYRVGVGRYRITHVSSSWSAE